MKKLMFLIPAAALALASCSSEDAAVNSQSAEQQGSMLQIRPAMSGLTRGDSWTDENFTKFYLNTNGSFQTDADNVNAASAEAFDNQEVTKNADGKWYIGDGSSTQLYYWPSKRSTSYFQAYNVAAGSYTADATTFANQKDIVVAYTPEGTASDFAAGVPLYFRHILSQVVFKADNSTPSDVQIKVAGIRLNTIKSTGSFTLPTASTESALGYTPWSGQATPIDYKATDAANAITLATATKDMSMLIPQMLIPQNLGDVTTDLTTGTGTYLSVLIQVMGKDGEGNFTQKLYPVAQTNSESEAIEGTGFAWVAVNLTTDWEAGKKYIYTLHFSKDGYGKVDADQGDGGTEDPTDTTPDDDTDDDDDPRPGDDIVDNPVELILDVQVVDWTEVTNDWNM